jgi:DNA-binding protein
MPWPLCGDPKNLIKAHGRAVVVAVILAHLIRNRIALRAWKNDKNPSQIPS